MESGLSLGLSFHPPSLIDCDVKSLWSVVYQKNCHLVSRNSGIREVPALICTAQTKTHQQQREREIVQVLQQYCSKRCSSGDFSFHSLPGLTSLLDSCSPVSSTYFILFLLSWRKKKTLKQNSTLNPLRQLCVQRIIRFIHHAFFICTLQTQSQGTSKLGF